MKTALAAALWLVAGYLAARRILPAPGATGAPGAVAWPIIEPSPWSDNQAGDWTTVELWPSGIDLPSLAAPVAAPAPVAWESWPLQVADDAYSAPGQGDTVPAQLSSTLSAAVATLGASLQVIPDTLGFTQPPAPDVAARNERAFLDMIAYAEGTAGPDGYRTMFGYRLFDSFADHPRQFFEFTNSRGETLRTSAAGRYQFLARTWDTLKKRLKLPDFGPESQDRAAIELIRERGALSDVRAGRVAAAVVKVAPVWASLPGAGYAQPERNLSALIATYTQAGGNLET